MKGFEFARAVEGNSGLFVYNVELDDWFISTDQGEITKFPTGFEVIPHLLMIILLIGHTLYFSRLAQSSPS